MNGLTTLPRLQQRLVLVPQKLHNSTHVFIRIDNVKPPLQPNYDGPLKVIKSTDKTVTVEKARKTDSIDIDRVKPAFIKNDHQPKSTNPSKTVASPKHEFQTSTTQMKRLQ